MKNKSQQHIDAPKKEAVNHPSHYGGKDNLYEAIKVIEAWELDFHLGNTVKYISRAGKKDSIIQELEKAEWYLKRKIENLKKEKEQEDKAYNQLRKQVLKSTKKKK